ncbi:MAG: hypothetical protein QM710_09370 [Flavobacterium sp.]
MNLKPILTVIIWAVIGFVLHKILFHFNVPKVYEDNFIYPLSLLYLLFGFFSVVILFVLLKVKQKSIDYVGYTYLLLTSVKMVIAYIFLHPILEMKLPQTPAEKTSFFVIFIYFLTIETIVTIRILNNKQ